LFAYRDSDVITCVFSSILSGHKSEVDEEYLLKGMIL